MVWYHLIFLGTFSWNKVLLKWLHNGKLWKKMFDFMITRSPQNFSSIWSIKELTNNSKWLTFHYINWSCILLKTMDKVHTSSTWFTQINLVNKYAFGCLFLIPSFYLVSWTVKVNCFGNQWSTYWLASNKNLSALAMLSTSCECSFNVWISSVVGTNFKSCKKKKCKVCARNDTQIGLKKKMLTTTFQDFSSSKSNSVMLYLLCY